MKDDCRRGILSAWQEKKKETITHPYLKEKVPWGTGAACAGAAACAASSRRSGGICPVFLEVIFMMILITYDVNTENAVGRKRLRRVAKICVNCGQRVQNSVFECVMDNAKLSQVRNALLKVVDLNEDSLRLYHLGKKLSRQG